MNRNESQIPQPAVEGDDLARARQQSHKLLRRILFILILTVAGLLLLLGTVALILKLTEAPPPTFKFYPVSEEDIMKNEEYLAKDRYIYYSDPNGVTERVDEEYLEAYPNAELQFVYDYIQTIIKGDEVLFHLFFSEDYYKRHEKQAAFTPQMLCNIDVEIYKLEEKENGDRLVTYRLEYDIYRNNGTYRNDCAPEKESPEFIALRVSKTGDIEIEQRYFYKERTR